MIKLMRKQITGHKYHVYGLIKNKKGTYVLRQSTVIFKRKREDLWLLMILLYIHSTVLGHESFHRQIVLEACNHSLFWSTFFWSFGILERHDTDIITVSSIGRWTIVASERSNFEYFLLHDWKLRVDLVGTNLAVFGLEHKCVWNERSFCFASFQILADSNVNWDEW